MNEKFDVYQMVTDRVIEALERGTVPWIHYLRSGGSNGYRAPKNFVTKKAYRGINLFLLGMSEFSSPYFLTFKQCASLGGSVKKGEHGTVIVFWKRLDKPETDETHEPAEHEVDRPHFVLRYYRVFNVLQCTGLNVPEEPKTEPEEKEEPFTPIERAEAIALHYLNSGNAPKLRHIDGLNTACYCPSLDEVRMPLAKQFISPERYAEVKSHELVHSTSYASRLNRKLGAKFGDTNYAREELVAEMGASMICALGGIFERTIDDCASYIANWLGVLKSDKKAVVVAAGAAQRAVDLIAGDQSEERHDLPLAA
jgi:antirestriction protein ArdC